MAVLYTVFQMRYFHEITWIKTLMQTRSRQQFLDVARGVGILLVVFGHVQRGLHDANLFTSSYPFETLDYYIYVFHMPLFFFLSGLHVWSSLEKGTGRFVKRKVVDIVVPYFIWSIIQGGVQVVMSGATNHALHASDWPKLFLDPIGQFWFLYALFVWMMVAVLTQRIRLLLIAVSVATFFIAGTSWCEAFSGFLSELLHMGIFFALGASALPLLLKHRARLGDWKFFVVISLAYLVATYVARMFGGFSDYSAFPAALLGMTMLISFSALVTDMFGSARTIFAELGLASMPIYLMHILAAAGVRIVLIHVGLRNEYIQLIVGTVIGVAAPLVVYRLYRSGLGLRRRPAVDPL